jgi:hypothetical protein
MSGARSVQKCVPRVDAQCRSLQRLRARQENTARCGRSESDRARGAVNGQPLSAWEPRCSAARCAFPQLSLRVAASGRSGSLRGGEQSGSQHQQPVSFPLPPNACAVIGSGNVKDFVCFMSSCENTRSVRLSPLACCVRRAAATPLLSPKRCTSSSIAPSVA